MVARYGRASTATTAVASTKLRGKRPVYPQLKTAVRVDVAILGGGVTGAIVAWRLASRRVRVAVLEAGRAGRGSTAASTALLMQEPDEDFSELAPATGPCAKPIWKLSRTATRDLIDAGPPRDLVRPRGARFDLLHPRWAIRELRREHRSRRRAGFPGRWLDAAASVALRASGAAAPSAHPVTLRSILTGLVSGSSTRLNAVARASTNDLSPAGSRSDAAACS